MLALLLPLATRLVGPRFAKASIYGVLALLLVILLGVGKCAYDRSVVNKYVDQVEQRAAPATNQASAERANDTFTNAKNEQEMHNVIAAQPDQPIAPTSRALSCERLRRAGRHSPACSGPPSGH